jgi:methanogenic corrinoid protein MtbC1
VTALLNIAALSRRTGVAPDTLRKWEQRYGVLQPTRTAGGQRRYSERDIQRVQWLRDRLDEGWRIGEAARVLQETAAPPLSDPADLREALILAALGDDPAQASATLDQALAVLPLEQAFDDVIAPTLRTIGDAWHRGEISVAQEHALTAKVRTRLDRLLSDPRGAARGTAVLACAPGEQHDVGLLMLAVAMRADGWRVEYLGPSTPAADALEFAEAIGAALVCISATRDATVEQLRDELDSLGARPALTLVVGGAAVDAGAAHALGVLHADDRLDPAVEKLRTLSAT